jgi:hypothetical protein
MHYPSHDPSFSALYASAASPRTRRDPLGNAKNANAILGHLGNAKTDCLNCQWHDAMVHM